jgi:hypothetical protein
LAVADLGPVDLAPLDRSVGDLTTAPMPDLSMQLDLASADLSVLADLSAPADLAEVPDLAIRCSRIQTVQPLAQIVGADLHDLFGLTSLGLTTPPDAAIGVVVHSTDLFLTVSFCSTIARDYMR